MNDEEKKSLEELKKEIAGIYECILDIKKNVIAIEWKIDAIDKIVGLD